MGYRIQKIYVGTNQVRPAVPTPPFVPGANTIAYYKFDWNLTDYSGNSHDLTNPQHSTYPVSYWTNPDCVILTSSNYLETTWIDDFTHDWSLNAWVNISARNGNEPSIVMSHWTRNTRSMVLPWLTSQWKPFFAFYADDHSGTTVIPLNTWANLCRTYNYSTRNYKTYVNWVVDIDGTLSQQYSIPQSNMCIWAMVELWGSSNYRVQWKVSQFILESKERTATEILDYFDATKSDYGIS